MSHQALWRDTLRVPLTHKAFEILRALVERAGHVVARETLMATVWPDTHVHPDNVKVLVGEIRRALGDDPDRPQFIRSIVKRGYVFIAPVVDGPADWTVQPPATPIFVGRGPEIDALVDAFDAAASGERRVVFVVGEPGIGKTALCEAFLRVAATRRAIRATWGQCVNLTGPSEPYYPLLSALSRLARADDDDVVGSTLARHAPSWLPHLPRLNGDGHAAVPPNARVASASRMLREIVTALEALTEDRPLVLWLEDLHYADPATLDVLISLGQRRDQARLLVLGTMRPPESIPAAGASRRAHGDLLALGRATELTLQPFTADEVTRYLAQRFTPGIAALSSEVLTRSTNGHPLFLVTAVDDLVRKGHFVQDRDDWRATVPATAIEAAIPASFAGAVTQELGELTADERQAIEAASVVGVEFSRWLVAYAAQVDELALEPILEMLARRRAFIVREGVIELANGMFSPLYRFKHGLYQELVLEHTAPPVRARTHARAGLALEQLFTGREREIAADLACHFHWGGDHARAARYFRLAAGNALKRYAAREAAALLHGAVTHVAHLSAEARAAVELPLMLELGQAQFAAGETGLATLTWTRLDKRSEDEHRPDDRLRALMALVEAYAGIASTEALKYARTITDIAPFATDSSLAASAAIRAGIVEIQFMGWSDQIAERCMEAWRSLSKSESDEIRALAIRLLLVQNLRSSYAGAWTAGRKLLGLALKSGNVPDCVYCYYLLGYAALHLGRWGDALEMATEGAAIGERTGIQRYAVTMRLLQAWIALEGQRWEEALHLSLADRPAIENGGWSYALQLSLLCGGTAALGLGRLSEAAADLDRLKEWHARERIVLDWFWEIQLHLALADLAVLRGDLERATAEAKAAQQAAMATPERTWRARAHITAARVAMERGALDDADRDLRQARREIRGIDAPLASWRLEAATATLLERTAQPDSARRARQKYEKTLGRLERSIGELQGDPRRAHTSRPASTLRPS